MKYKISKIKLNEGIEEVVKAYLNNLKISDDTNMYLSWLKENKSGELDKCKETYEDNLVSDYVCKSRHELDPILDLISNKKQDDIYDKMDNFFEFYFNKIRNYGSRKSKKK